MPTVVRETDLSVPVGALFEAITTFDKYPEFLPEVVRVEEKPSSGPNKKTVTFELDLLKRFRYTLEFEMTDNSIITWKLIDSDLFKQNEGRWVLAANGPDKTHVTYELSIGFGFFVPSWVAKKLTETNLPQMFKNFETQAKKNV